MPVFEDPSVDAEKAWQRRRILSWFVLITVAHLVLGRRTHGLHAIHILLASLYLFPIFWASLAFELRGGVIASLTTAATYFAHIVWSWSGEPLTNVDQYGMLGVYLFVGISSGLLVRSAERRRRQRDEVIRRARRSETLQGLHGLILALGARDAATLSHCERVGSLANELGKRFGLDEERLTNLRLSGLLHDLGKIGIRDDLLFSRERLTPAQVEEIKTHVQTAVRLIRSIYGAEEIAQIVASHHEALDGSGYPLGACGEAISLEGRILSVVDVFVALTEDRPYRAATTSPQALDMMRPSVGSKLDPRCFAALEELVTEERPGRSSLLAGSASERRLRR